MEACNYAMQTMVELVCRKGYVPLDEATDINTARQMARDTARQLGGEVVRVTVDEVTRGGILIKRYGCIIQVATGILTTTTVANSLPQQMVKIEQTAEAVGVSRVTTAPAAAATATAEVVSELAKEIGKTTPIKGESILESAVKGVTKASARFNIAINLMEILRIAQSARHGSHRDEQQQKASDACCLATNKAHQTAWKQAPDKFHRESMKTRDTKLRYYGKRRSRRN